MKKDLWNATCRKENPYKVPDGYFEGFTGRMMAQIPACEEALQEKPKEESPKEKVQPISLYTRIKPYLYLAATFCGLYFGIQVFKYQSEKIQDRNNNITAQQESQAIRDQFIEDFCDYANIDHEDIYDCVTEGNHESF